MIKELLKMDGAGKDAPSSKTKLNNTGGKTMLF